MSDVQKRRCFPRTMRTARWLALAASLALTATALAEPKLKVNAPVPTNVVRPAPEFAWIGAGGKPSPLKTFRGQPVVLIVAPSPDFAPMRKEARRIEELYLQFSARKTVFLAAFTQQTGRVESDVPFAIAENGAAVAAAYGVPANELSVIVISPDGNVDITSTKVEGAQRILDVINNTFQAQSASRAGGG